MLTKRVFYYLDSDNQDEVFNVLDDQVENGFITYEQEESEGIIIIDCSMIDDEDILFKNLKDLGLSEEDPSDYNIEPHDDIFGDFLNEDDFED